MPRLEVVVSFVETPESNTPNSTTSFADTRPADLAQVPEVVHSVLEQIQQLFSRSQNRAATPFVPTLLNTILSVPIFPLEVGATLLAFPHQG